MFILATAIASPNKALDAQGVPWVDNRDGTFSLDIDSPHTIGDLKEQGGVLFQYEGPNRIPYDARLYKGERRANYADVDNDLIGTVQIDSYGGRWVAIDAKPELLAASRQKTIDAAERPDEGLWTPLMYTDSVCPPDSDWHQWNAESRFPINAYSDSHELHRSVVKVRNILGGICTGVMVGPEDILTSAHCLTVDGAPGGVLPVQSICSQGNNDAHPDADCMDSNQGGLFNFVVSVNGKWTRGSDNLSNDYALIEWGFPRSNLGPTANQWTNADRQSLIGVTNGVPMTSWTGSTINSVRAGTYGHPGRIGGTACTSTSTASAETSFDPGIPGSDLYFQWRTDHWHSNTHIKTHYDASSGQSGSPIYQCMESPVNCEDDTLELVGLLAGKHGGSNGWVGGPRASQFEDWMRALSFSD